MGIVYTQVTREIEREVARCRGVQVTMTDPCTGCCYTVCRLQPVVEKVKCVVYDCVPSQVEQTVRVCNYKPVERTYETNRMVCDRAPKKAEQRVRVCMYKPRQRTKR